MNKNKNSFGVAGKWMTEEDLDEEFKNKPIKKKAIMDNSETWVHPVTRLKMWKVEEFIAASSAETEEVSQRKRKTEFEGEIKPKKQPKAPKQPKPEPGRPL